MINFYIPITFLVILLGWKNIRNLHGRLRVRSRGGEATKKTFVAASLQHPTELRIMNRPELVEKGHL